MPQYAKPQKGMKSASGVSLPMKGGSGDMMATSMGSKGGSNAMPKMAMKERMHAESVAAPPDMGVGSLNRSVVGDDPRVKKQKMMQKKGYAGKGMQAKGSGNPSAKKATKKSPKERNLTSKTYF